METPAADISEYIKDLEVCRSQDKIKHFYEHCQSQYECVADTQTTFADIQEYGANLLKEFLCDDLSLILDVGCGVGDTGKSLRKAGFRSFHGTDPSLNNIQITKDKNIYSKLYTLFKQADGCLTCTDDSYDGLICIGKMFNTHLIIQHAINEFCRVIKPGGYAVFTFDVKLDARELMVALGDAMFKRRIDVGLMEKQEFRNTDGVQMSCYCCVIKILDKF